MTADIKWLAQLGAAEIRTDTLDQERESYPYAQWVNGDPKLKQLGASAVAYTGGWFIPAELVSLETIPGWTAGNLSHDRGETEGFFSPRLSIAAFHMRRCWRVGQDQGSRLFAWNDYEAAKAWGAARGRLQILGIIRGLEDVGPMMLTMGGTTGMAFTSRDGILAQHRQLVLKPAAMMSSRAAKRRVTEYPRFYFWLTVGAETDDKEGAPVFTKVGQGDASSLVTRPVLVGVTKGMTAQQLGELYVGPELITIIEGTRDPVTGQWSEDGLFDTTKSWAEAWDQLGQPTQNAAANLAALDAAADNNVLIDEELPF